MADEIIGRLSPSMRYRIGFESGDIFEVDDDFDGITLTIEVKDVAEGEALTFAVERRNIDQ